IPLAATPLSSWIKRTAHLSMKDIQFSSPETDRKIAWSASVIFMLFAWIFMAAGLVWFMIAGLQPDAGKWSALAYVIVGIFLVVVVLAPIQLVRYLHERRRQR